MKYLVVIEKGPTSFGAYVPDLPGCVAVAKTRRRVSRLIREAVQLHVEDMRARGYRLPRGAGHHVRTGSYARAALDGAPIDEHLDAFDELRQLRNQGEYDALLLDAGDVAEVLAHADAIIHAIERSL